MFDFSFYELMVFGVIALIVLGPEKLPQAVRTIGTYYAKFRRTVGTLKAEMEAELDLVETRQQMEAELAKIKQAEADMQKEMAQLRGSMRDFEQQQHSQLKSAAQQAGTIASRESSSEDHSYAYGSNPNISPKKTETIDTNHPSTVNSTDDVMVMTRPWENMWFLLGDYDRAKRLPPAPLLPNYEANPLLYASQIVDSEVES